MKFSTPIVFLLVFWFVFFLEAQGSSSMENSVSLSKEDYFDLLSIELKKKLDLKIDNDGWPSVRPEIYYIYLHGRYSKKAVSLNEARALVVEAVETVMNFINESNPGIIQYLCEHPFSPEKMYFEIDLEKNDQLNDPLINVSYYRGTVDYFYEFDKIQVPKETFEEAKAKVLKDKR